MTTTYAIGEIGERPWGTWQVLDAMPGIVLKKICVKSGERLSLQSHQHRSERWLIAAGIATVENDGRVFDLTVGEMAEIPQGSVHRITNKHSETVCVIELQIGDILDEDDITRYEDDYNR